MLSLLPTALALLLASPNAGATIIKDFIYLLVVLSLVFVIPVYRKFYGPGRPMQALYSTITDENGAPLQLEQRSLMQFSASTPEEAAAMRARREQLRSQTAERDKAMLSEWEGLAAALKTLVDSSAQVSPATQSAGFSLGADPLAPGVSTGAAAAPAASDWLSSGGVGPLSLAAPTASGLTPGSAVAGQPLGRPVPLSETDQLWLNALEADDGPQARYQELQKQVDELRSLAALSGIALRLTGPLERLSEVLLQAREAASPNQTPSQREKVRSSVAHFVADELPQISANLRSSSPPLG